MYDTNGKWSDESEIILASRADLVISIRNRELDRRSPMPKTDEPIKITLNETDALKPFLKPR